MLDKRSAALERHYSVRKVAGRGCAICGRPAEEHERRAGGAA